MNRQLLDSFRYLIEACARQFSHEAELAASALAQIDENQKLSGFAHLYHLDLACGNPKRRIAKAFGRF